ncbi:hypothetical protein HPB48_008622 [Haemaphysalis longicornis]|uniref:Uncharacterized protein n=1 Tax=Haemaphysalis longicornis TaxID=44386 RepID=A0A9J6FIM8_HAELO|nr:hypothetical protein HPB48_008622 [Haemaphysalis longicornis]
MSPYVVSGSAWRRRGAPHATVLCLIETWNAPQRSIDGYRVFVCTDDAERPSGGVAIYVKHSLTAVDLKLPLTSQSHNGEQAAITLHTGTDIVIMTMYRAPNLSRANVETYIDKAMVTYKTYKETALHSGVPSSASLQRGVSFVAHEAHCLPERTEEQEESGNKYRTRSSPTNIA